MVPIVEDRLVAGSKQLTEEERAAIKSELDTLAAEHEARTGETLSDAGLANMLREHVEPERGGLRVLTGETVRKARGTRDREPESGFKLARALEKLVGRSLAEMVARAKGEPLSPVSRPPDGLEALLRRYERELTRYPSKRQAAIMMWDRAPIRAIEATLSEEHSKSTNADGSIADPGGKFWVDRILDWWKTDDRVRQEQPDDAAMSAPAPMTAPATKKAPKRPTRKANR